MTQTSNQVKKIPNPTGKGGFQERPQDRNLGTWKPENSQSYCIRKFLSMTETNFVNWGKENPSDSRTVAQVLAYDQVTRARNELGNYKEIINRTEGMPTQPTDLTSAGERILGPIIYTPEKMKPKNE